MTVAHIFEQPDSGSPLCSQFIDRVCQGHARPVSWQGNGGRALMLALRELDGWQQHALLLSLDPLLLLKDALPYREREEQESLFIHLLRTGLPGSALAIDMILRIMTAPANPFQSYFIFGSFVRFLTEVTKDGAEFTGDQQRILGDLVRQLEKFTNSRTNKHDQATWLKVLRELNRLPGLERTRNDVRLGRIADLVAAEPSPIRFRPLPDNIAFWCRFLDRVADRAEQLRGEILSGKAGWIKNEAAFHARFRSVAGVPVEFGFWDSDSLRFGAWDGRNFAVLRGPDYRRSKAPVLVSMPLEMLTLLRSELAVLGDHVWSAPWMPGIDVLLGVKSDADVDFVLMLIDAKPGTAPPAKWSKDIGKLIDRIGPDAVMRRIHAWLSLFARPGFNDTTLTLFHDCHERAIHAQSFERSFPHWKDLPEPDLAALADWIALTAIAHGDRAPLGLDGFADHYNKLLPEDQRHTARRLLFRYGDRERKDYALRHGWPYAYPGLHNENALRAAAWLLGEHAADGRVALLEDVAMAATGIKSSDRYRSRSLANAAIESLGRIGTAEALHALGRLRRSIDDGLIGIAVQKAIDKLADRQSVDPDDVAEMGLPDYGLE